MTGLVYWFGLLFWLVGSVGSVCWFAGLVCWLVFFELLDWFVGLVSLICWFAGLVC